MAQTISRADLIAKLLSHDYDSAVYVKFRAVPSKLRKTSNPYHGNCVQERNLYGRINRSYVEEVNRARRNEGLLPTFQAGERVWGEAIPNTPLIKHNGKVYLGMIVTNSGFANYFTLDGDPIAYRDIAPFIPERKEDNNQGLVNPVKCANIEIGNIVELTLDNVDYDVVD